MLSFLNPKEFALRESLEDVMVLLPSYKQPHPMTRNVVDGLIKLGVDVQASWGCSDPALHRCLMAGRAWDVLRRDAGKYGYVLWMDDDMLCKPWTVQFMRACCQQLNVAVTGYYCKRGQSSGLAFSRMPGEPLGLSLERRDGERESVELVPVIGGMGCMIVPREQFLLHLESVPNVAKQTDGKRSDMPGICSSGYCPDDQGVLGWMSEDSVYCQSLWHYGRGVYAAPVVWAHISEMPLLPLPDAHWMNEHDDENAEIVT